MNSEERTAGEADSPELPESFSREPLDDVHAVFVGQLPDELTLDAVQFAELWSQHPNEYHEITIRGKLVKTPRWQQAFGREYTYTGQTKPALPVSDLIRPFLDWAQNNIDRRENGVLLNWYDGTLGHYIGKHRDSTVNLIEGAPIVMISFGDARPLRFRPWRGTGFEDVICENGGVVIMPWETNLHWTHEMPRSKAWKGRRISMTIRAFGG